MHKFKFLHSADNHLGKTNFGHTERLLDFAGVLVQIKNIAVREQCELIILAGDVFDSPDPDPTSADVFRAFCEQLSQLGIYLVALTGNHDRHPLKIPGQDGLPTRVESMGSNVNSLRSTLNNGAWRVPVKNPAYANQTVTLVAADWMPASKIPEFLKGLPAELDILAMHQSCSGFNPKIATTEMELEWLAGKAKYVAMGDLHMRKEMRPSPDTIVAYPASTEMCSMDESPDKSVNVVTFNLETREVEKIDYHPIARRAIIEVRIESPEQLAMARETFKANPESIVLLKYAPEFAREAKAMGQEWTAMGKTQVVIDQPLPKITTTDTFTCSKESADVEMVEVIEGILAGHEAEKQAAVSIWNNPDNVTEILAALC